MRRPGMGMRMGVPVIVGVFVGMIVTVVMMVMIVTVMVVMGMTVMVEIGRFQNTDPAFAAAATTCSAHIFFF